MLHVVGYLQTQKVESRVDRKLGEYLFFFSSHISYEIRE